LEGKTRNDVCGRSPRVVSLILTLGGANRKVPKKIFQEKTRRNKKRVVATFAKTRFILLALGRGVEAEARPPLERRDV
jgi:hypothetical protein